MRNMIGKLILMSTVAVNTFAAHAITAEKRFEVPFSFTVRGTDLARRYISHAAQWGGRRCSSAKQAVQQQPGCDAGSR